MIDKLLNKYKAMSLPLKLTMWIFICTCIQRGINIITVPIFTRLMSQEEYGQFSVFMSWQSIIEILVSLRLYAGVYNKGLNKYSDKMNEYALTMQYITTILTFILCSIYMIFRRQVGSFTGLSTTITIGMFAELLLSTPISYWSIKERYKYQYKGFVIATIIFAIVNPIIGIIAVLSSDNKGEARIYALIWVQIIYGLIFYLINCINGKWKFNIEHAKFALIFNIPLLPHYLSEYILNSSDRIMIEKMQGYSYAGLYSVAYGMGMILTMLTTSINQALVPWMYQSFKHKKFEYVRKVTTAIGMILIIPLSIFIILAPEMINIFAGKSYAPSIYVIPPVCCSIFILFWYTICANIEFFYEKNKFTMYISIVGALCNIGLNYILIPQFGFVAAGYTTLISYMIYGIGHLFFSQIIFYKAEGRYLFSNRIYISQLFLIFSVSIVASFLYEFVLVRYILCLIIVIVIIYYRNIILSLIQMIRDNYK